ncbi:MAG: hypothetical protein AMJ91_02330 [candidate division Zixibacteria bacterium SM23_73_3]|nr:MAG: hypothetical protein AMJ91_02330 [candidate division Zixibacteria bacterium SM23_73_3]
MRSSKYLLCFSLVVAVVFFLSSTQPSEAQIPGMPKLYGEFKTPEVGAYVTYKVINIKNKVERITKLSIVGIEKSEGGVAKILEEGEIKKVVEGGKVQPILKPKGEDLYWYEVEETDPKTGYVAIMKMLISGNPQDIGIIHRMIVKSAKEPASELPQAFVQMINQTPAQETEANKPKIKNLGTEKVKIKSETLECAHLQYISPDKTTAEVWTNAKVPLLGMVKSTTPEITMELLEYGTDAVSAIEEKPEVLEMK